MSDEELWEMADSVDWQQVVLNGGPPCFHHKGTRFCLRAERWDGHRSGFHEFVSLSDFFKQVRDQTEQRVLDAINPLLQDLEKDPMLPMKYTLRIRQFWRDFPGNTCNPSE